MACAHRCWVCVRQLHLRWELTHKHTRTHAYTHTHTRIYTHAHTHSLSHRRTHARARADREHPIIHKPPHPNPHPLVSTSSYGGCASAKGFFQYEAVITVPSLLLLLWLLLLSCPYTNPPPLPLSPPRQSSGLPVFSRARVRVCLRARAGTT